MKTQILLLMCALIVLSSHAQAKTIYVDEDANGNNNGTNWINAYPCLQNALADAVYGDEIRVANGTYKPDQYAIMRGDHIQIISSGDWTETFQLIEGVTIKGGYAGYGEPNPDIRDLEQYECILSGDLNGDDDLEFTNIWDNSYHVVTASRIKRIAVLDGFTIIGGNADGPFPYDNGAGIYNVEGNPTVINCKLIGNFTTGKGGGIFNDNSEPAMLNCLFNGNLSNAFGGGMYNLNSNPTLNNCIFSENYAGVGGGGGIYNENSNSMSADCVFNDNSTLTDGGGIYNNGSDSKFLSCTFNNNLAVMGGGGICNINSSQPYLTNCIFSGNSAFRGGAIENLDSNLLQLTNCTFSSNSAENVGGGIFNIRTGQLKLTNCILWGNLPDEVRGPANICYSNIENGWLGEGMNNLDTDPLFADSKNGDYHLKSQAGRWSPDAQSWVIDQVSSPCIDNGEPNNITGLERFPNGNRINIGAYGGTPQASLSLLRPVLDKASNPIPADGAVDVSLDVILSWTSDTKAIAHDVYFGTDFKSVSLATRDIPLDVLVSQEQYTLTYEPTQLTYGQTYYWRIDEISTPSDPDIFTGQVWSFTVESIGDLFDKIPASSITATASSSFESLNPNNTINESGLNPNNMDLHSNNLQDMWRSAIEENDPWIRYDFDKVYKLSEMFVWNFNYANSLLGFNEVTIKYSIDGQNWQVLPNVPQFEQATTFNDYEYNTIVNLNNISAKSIILTANNNLSGGNTAGLSEVRFIYIISP